MSRLLERIDEMILAAKEKYFSIVAFNPEFELAIIMHHELKVQFILDINCFWIPPKEEFFLKVDPSNRFYHYKYNCCPILFSQEIDRDAIKIAIIPKNI